MDLLEEYMGEAVGDLLYILTRRPADPGSCLFDFQFFFRNINVFDKEIEHRIDMLLFKGTICISRQFWDEFDNQLMEEEFQLLDRETFLLTSVKQD